MPEAAFSGRTALSEEYLPSRLPARDDCCKVVEDSLAMIRQGRDRFTSGYMVILAQERRRLPIGPAETGKSDFSAMLS
jgi:Cdc6-like AAA superfamily ATPase